jgi:hypothetical protein
MPDIKPRVRPLAAGEDRRIHADTHLSKDRCQNGGNGSLDNEYKRKPQTWKCLGFSSCSEIL